MSSVDRSAVESAIRTAYQDPYLNQDLLSLDAIRNLEIDGGKVSLRSAWVMPWGLRVPRAAS